MKPIEKPSDNPFMLYKWTSRTISPKPEAQCALASMQTTQGTLGAGRTQNTIPRGPAWPLFEKV